MILKKIHCRLKPLSSKSRIVAFFVLAHSVFLLMMVFTFPRINAKFGTQAFDLKTFGYSATEASAMLQNLDQPTIDFYIFPQLFFLDILYPILLALFLSTLIIRLSHLNKIGPNHFLSNLFILPFITMFLDYIENILISVMISNGTKVSIVVIHTASLFTQMKGAFTTVSWTIILILFGYWLKNKWQDRRMLNHP